MNEHLRALRLRRRLEEAGPVLWQAAAGVGSFSLAAGGVFCFVLSVAKAKGKTAAGKEVRSK